MLFKNSSNAVGEVDESDMAKKVWADLVRSRFDEGGLKEKLKRSTLRLKTCASVQSRVS